MARECQHSTTEHNTTAIVPISIILKQEDGTNVNSQIDSSRSSSSRVVAANNRDRKKEEEGEKKLYLHGMRQINVVICQMNGSTPKLL